MPNGIVGGKEENLSYIYKLKETFQPSSGMEPFLQAWQYTSGQTNFAPVLFIFIFFLSHTHILYAQNFTVPGLKLPSVLLWATLKK